MQEHVQAWIREDLEAIEEQQLRRVLAKRESPHVAGMVQIDGRQFIGFGSNDYLGLSADSRLVDAMRQAAGYIGCGSAASPLISGRGVIHARLERELAAFEQTEASLVFPTGYAANVGTIGALVSKPDAIFSDERNHASIIDGCRLSGARIHVYRHADLDHLAHLLGATDSFRRKMIVSDSLFSMDGDFAPLPALVKLAHDYQAILMIDEAHATGVFGDTGRGLCEHFAVETEVDVRVGTLSKALGCFGGFVVGNRQLIELILNRARTYIFSTAQPEAIANATLAALEIVQTEPERRQRLMKLSEQLRHRLTVDGWNIGTSTSQIVPIIIGAADPTMAMCDRLKELGFFVPGIRPPSVPPGKSLLRTSVTASHTREMIDRFCDALASLRT